MKLTPGRSTAAPLMLVALAARIFWGITLDFPRVQNAAWLCPLLGLVFYLPFAFAATQAGQLGLDSAWGNISNRVPRGIVFLSESVFVVLLLVDCAASTRLMANISSAMALSDASITTLEFPLVLVIATVILMGADAEGNSARFWIRILPLLLLIMIIAQFSSYNPRWITPILGSGVQDIFGGSLYCASCMVLLTLLWMIAVPDCGKHGPLPAVFVAAVSASILLLLQQMLRPALMGTEFTRAARIELVLSNGRVALSLQMLLIVIWYGSILHLIAGEALTAACYVHRLFPKLPAWGIAIPAAILIFFMASSRHIHTIVTYNSFRMEYAIIGFALLIPMLCAFIRKGGARS